MSISRVVCYRILHVHMCVSYNSTPHHHCRDDAVARIFTRHACTRVPCRNRGNHPRAVFVWVWIQKGWKLSMLTRFRLSLCPWHAAYCFWYTFSEYFSPTWLVRSLRKISAKHVQVFLCAVKELPANLSKNVLENISRYCKFVFFCFIFFTHFLVFLRTRILFSFIFSSGYWKLYNYRYIFLLTEYQKCNKKKKHKKKRTAISYYNFSLQA